MRRSNLSINAAALLGSAFIIASLVGAPRHATAALVFDVIQNTWGTPSEVGSFAWAIDQANTQAGVDTINVAAGLQINVDNATAAAGTTTWLARFTESANVQGNGAKLVGNPAYITTGGTTATKTTIIGSPYSPAIELGDVVPVPAISFAQIGTPGDTINNPFIHVSFSDLSADGLASIAQLNEGSQLSVTGGDFENLVNYTGTNAAGRGVFEANTGSTLNLSEISITRSFPFDNVIDISPNAAVFFGTIQGEDSQLNMQNSSINTSYGAGAIAWTGGTANIVSSIINDAGGLEVIDGDTDGVLNFVNSILYMTGGDDLSQTNRIQAAVGGEANILASTILYDALSTDDGCAVSYQCNGMPLTALLDGVLNFDSSAVVPLNAEFAFTGKDSYSEFTNGNLVAGEYSYIGATPTQDATEVRSLFGNLGILTEGDTYDLIDAGPLFELFNPLPGGAYPLLGGVLTKVIPNAGSGGANELLNPIDGQPILFDVYGNPRTDANGFRDIGAVQLQVPEPHAFSAALAGFFFYGMASTRQRKRKATRVETRQLQI